MYQASEKYINAVSQPSRTFTARLTDARTGHEIPCSIQDYELQRFSTDGDLLCIGGAFSANVKIDLITKVPMKNRSFFLETGIGGEYLPDGYFKVIDTKTKNGLTTIEAYDRMYIAGGRTCEACKISGTISVKVAAKQIAKALGCRGVDLSGLDDINITIPEGCTLQQLAGYIAGLHGANAFIGRDGKLCFHAYQVADFIFDADRTGDLTIDEVDRRIDVIKCKISEDTILSTGEAEDALQIENPLMTEERLKIIQEKLNEIHFHEAEVPLILGDNRLDPWDMICFREGNVELLMDEIGALLVDEVGKYLTGADNGISYTTMIMCHEIVTKFDGGLQQDISSHAETESLSISGNDGSWNGSSDLDDGGWDDGSWSDGDIGSGGWDSVAGWDDSWNNWDDAASSIPDFSTDTPGYEMPENGTYWDYPWASGNVDALGNAAWDDGSYDIEYDDISDNASYDPIDDGAVLAVEIDFQNGTITRIGDTAGIAAGTDFDNFPMYGGRQPCRIFEDGSVSETEYVPGDVMESFIQPVFWYKVEPINIETSATGPILRKARYYICGKNRPGFRRHEAFRKADGRICDKIYITRRTSLWRRGDGIQSQISAQYPASHPAPLRVFYAEILLQLVESAAFGADGCVDESGYYRKMEIGASQADRKIASSIDLAIAMELGISHINASAFICDSYDFSDAAFGESLKPEDNPSYQELPFKIPKKRGICKGIGWDESRPYLMIPISIDEDSDFDSCSSTQLALRMKPYINGEEESAESSGYWCFLPQLYLDGRFKGLADEADYGRDLYIVTLPE